MIVQLIVLKLKVNGRCMSVTLFMGSSDVTWDQGQFPYVFSICPTSLSPFPPGFLGHILSILSICGCNLSVWLVPEVCLGRIISCYHTAACQLLLFASLHAINVCAIAVIACKARVLTCHDHYLQTQILCRGRILVIRIYGNFYLYLGWQSSVFTFGRRRYSVCINCIWCRWITRENCQWFCC
jgi:hypothetical protein